MPADRSRPSITLARALSKLGAASRSQARLIIEAGRVAVAGRVVRDPDLWIDPSRAAITLDGKAVRRAPFVYFLLHKPPGFVTTRSDERGRRTVYDLLPAGAPRVFPVGRLDLETSGLLILTNDTQFGERATHPSSHVEKVYRVEVDREPSAEELAALEAPMVLADGTRLLPGKVTRGRHRGTQFELCIREGKNRQIRRACAHIGLQVVKLHRLRVGALSLGALPEGACRELRPLEAARALA